MPIATRPLRAALRRSALAVLAALTPALAGAQSFDAFTSTTIGGSPLTAGNQTFAGTLANQFRVGPEAVRITAFGAFDDGGNGFARTITVRLYDAATEQQVGESLTFTGTVGTAVGAYRFLTLATPIVLPSDFVGRIAAIGYGTVDERYYNAFFNGNDRVTAYGGSLVALQREYYADGDAFPTTASGNGEPGWYGAANFQFERASVPQSAVPEPASVALLTTGVMAIGGGAAARRRVRR